MMTYGLYKQRSFTVMVYSYDEKNKKIRLVKVPTLKGEDVKRVENAKVPISFLNSVMKLKLNIVST